MFENLFKTSDYSGQTRPPKSDSQFVFTTETRQESKSLIELVTVSAFSEAFQYEVLTTGNKDASSRLIELGSTFHLHLFFSTHTQKLLEELIFADSDMRDLIYRILMQIKYNLSINDIQYDALVDYLAEVSYKHNLVKGYEDIELSKAQELFNQGYVVKEDIPKATLYLYDWSAVMLLLNLNYNIILTVFKELFNYSK